MPTTKRAAFLAFGARYARDQPGFFACRSEFVSLGIEYASLDVCDEPYDFLADWERSTREWAAGPEDNAILNTIMSREQRAIAGR
jgi:hypothetical protein